MENNLACWVVRKNRQYLMGCPEFFNFKPKYSPHAYDAAQIKNANDARRVANAVGGNIHRFDPLTGVVV